MEFSLDLSPSSTVVQAVSAGMSRYVCGSEAGSCSMTEVCMGLKITCFLFSSRYFGKISKFQSQTLQGANTA